MKPVRNKESWSAPLAGVLTQTVKGYYDSIPLRRPRIEPPKRATALERAIASGVVKLRGGGRFTGSFDASVSKELAAMGGRYDGYATGWLVPVQNIPMAVWKLAREVDEASAGWREKVKAAVDNMGPITIIAAMALPGVYRYIAGKVAGAIGETTGAEVTPPTDPNAGNNFAMTVETAVRGFSDRETRAITKLIRRAAEDEWTPDELETALMGRAQMAQDRAKAMARQGMSIAATDLKASMYIQAGFPRYRWETKRDGRVRSDHQELDGEIFEWANPPLVNKATGLHAHPQQDWGCRCEAVPVED